MKISNQIKKAIQVQVIEKIKANLVGSDEKKFRAIMELGVLFKEALNYYNEGGGKEALRDANPDTPVNVDTFCVEVLKFTKSWVYKVVKASNVDGQTIEKFLDVVRELNAQGHYTEASIQNLNKFVKDQGQFIEDSVLQDTAEDTTEGEGEGEGEGEAKGNTIFTLSWKRDGQNVALRVDDNGQFITNNAPEQLAEAIEFLQGVLAELTANMEG